MWNKQKTFVPERGITAKKHSGARWVKLKLAKKHRNTNSSKETQDRERD